MRYSSLFHVSLVAANFAGAIGVENEALGANERRSIRTARRRTATPSAVEIQGLDILKTYVCPPCANLVKRQSEVVRGTTTVAIPVSDLTTLYTELEAILAQLAAMIAKQGLELPAVTTSPVSVPSVVVGSGILLSSSTTAKSVSASTASAVEGGTFLEVSSSSGAGSQSTAAPATTSSTSTLAPYDQFIVTITVTQYTTVTWTPPTDATTQESESVTRPAAISTTSSSISAGQSTANSTVLTTSPSPAAGLPSVHITIKVGTSPLTKTAISSTTTDSVCYDDDNETTSTIRSTSTTPTSVAVPITTTSRSVAATSTTVTSGGAFIESRSSSTTIAVPVATGSTSGYKFNAASPANVAVYFGQTPITGSSSLVAQCADPNIDIVVLAFVVQNAYQGSVYPQVNFGAACNALQTDAMRAQAPGLLSCPDLAGMINTCQKTYGKKILLSIGGATSQVIFTEQKQAVDFGTVLWQLFGPPGKVDIGLRPFGQVALDGFDIDNENNHPASYDVLGSTLKNLYASDSSKSYYLTSAPQCPFPDASNPPALLLNCDFVFVQFYNNPQCEIGSSGFSASVSQWSTFLQTSTSATKPRLYIGAPAWSAAGPTAYANIGSAAGMSGITKSVVGMGLNNLGGVMFWDGPEGMANLADGKDIIAWAKSALVSRVSGRAGRRRWIEGRE